MLLGIIFVTFFLSYILLRNPYKSIHEQIFSTADAVRSYYRDQPGYWKLSTESATTNNLINKELLKRKDFKLQIGQGVNGETGIPGSTTFDISLSNLNKSSCISLAELNISKNRQLALLKIAIINEENTTEFSWGGEHPLPITTQEPRQICQPTGNTILWTFQ